MAGLGDRATQLQINVLTEVNDNPSFAITQDKPSKA